MATRAPPHVVWDSREQLHAFITQQGISQQIQDALGLAAATAAAAFDVSVYSKNSLLKLPLCSKPGSQPMALYRWGIGPPPTEREQLNAGMITLPVLTAAWQPLTLLGGEARATTGDSPAAVIPDPRETPHAQRRTSQMALWWTWYARCWGPLWVPRR